LFASLARGLAIFSLELGTGDDIARRHVAQSVWLRRRPALRDRPQQDRRQRAQSEPD